MKFLKKIIRSLILLCAVMIISFVSVAKVPKTVQAVSDNYNKLTIIIDAGHGGLTNTTN